MESVLPINMESPALLNAGIHELVLCCINLVVNNGMVDGSETKILQQNIY